MLTDVRHRSARPGRPVWALTRHLPETSDGLCTSLFCVRVTMSTEEPKSESPATSEAKAELVSAAAVAGNSQAADVDAAVAWPPPEAAPDGDAKAPTTASSEKAPAAETAASAEKAPGGEDSGVMTAPDPAPKAESAKVESAKTEAGKAADGDMPAATPQEEMALSNSTLHWLEDGDQAVPSRLTEPGTMPSYDPRAPVPGRRRAVLVTGVAAVVALIVAGTLYAQAQKRKAAQAPTAVVVEPARDLTNQAEAALAANQVDRALELAHLALVADQRFADAHFVVGKVELARSQATTARDEFRKYLELAPLGTHAEAARKALATLPP